MPERRGKRAGVARRVGQLAAVAWWVVVGASTDSLRINTMSLDASWWRSGRRLHGGSAGHLSLGS
jgi:hypothetical protein